MQLRILLAALVGAGSAGWGAAGLLRARQAPGADVRAFQRVAAVEELRTSRVLCRIGASDGFGSVTVRLHHDNSRSVAFNGDVQGYESKVKCVGEPDSSCTNATASRDATSAAECPSCPCAEPDGALSGPYSRLVAAEIDARCGQAAPRVLLLGLGCGELATHVARRCSSMQVDAVEYDPRLPALAQQYFGLPDSVQVVVGDALPVVLAKQQDIAEHPLTSDSKKYDIVFVDCFSDGGVTPEHCRSAEFVHALRGIVRGEGRIIHHLWHEDPQHSRVAADFAATVDLYRKEFVCGGCKVDVKPVGEESVDSLVLVSAGASADV